MPFIADFIADGTVIGLNVVLDVPTVQGGLEVDKDINILIFSRINECLYVFSLVLLQDFLRSLGFILILVLLLCFIGPI